jgi:hypothetical protein
MRLVAPKPESKKPFVVVEKPKPVLGFRLRDSLPYEESLESHVRKKLDSIKDEINTLEDGTKTIGTRTFCRLSGIAEPTLRKKTNGKSKYSHLLIDGTEVEVEIKKGPRNTSQFVYDDCVKLLFAMFECNERTILVTEMSQLLRLSPFTIKKWFANSGGKMEIEVDGKTHTVTLEKGAYGIGPGKIFYMLKNQFELLKQWVEENHKERNWEGKKKLVLTNDYVDVSTAAKMLGEDSNYVRHKIESGKLPAEKAENGEWVILKTDVENMMNERLNLAPPEGCIRIWKMLKRLDKDRYWYDARVTEIEGKPHISVKDNSGISHNFELFRDFDGSTWIMACVVQEIKSILGSLSLRVDREEAAAILGINALTFRSYVDPKKQVLAFPLQDRTIIEIPYLLISGENMFLRSDIETVAEKNRQCNERMVYLPEIASALGQSEGFVKRLFLAADKTITFSIDDKEYYITLKTAYSTQMSFLFKDELALLKRFLALNGSKRARNKIPLFGPQTSELGFEFSLDAELSAYPSLLKRIRERCNGCTKPISIVPEYNLVIPFIGSNGTKKISGGGVILLTLYCELFASENGNTFARKAEVALDFLNSFDEDNPAHVAGLWLIRKFVSENLDRFSLGVLDVKLKDVLNIPDPEIRSYVLLTKMLERAKFYNVFRAGFEPGKSPYFSEQGIILFPEFKETSLLEILTRKIESYQPGSHI